MQKEDEKGIKKPMQQCSSAEGNGLFLATLQELNLLISSSEPTDNAVTVPRQLSPDLLRLTPEVLTTLCREQGEDSTPAAILSSLAATAMLRSLINSVNGWDEQQAKIDGLLELAAEALWKRDYPSGGSIHQTYDSLSFQDKEIYREAALTRAKSGE